MVHDLVDSLCGKFDNVELLYGRQSCLAEKPNTPQVLVDLKGNNIQAKEFLFKTQKEII